MPFTKFRKTQIAGNIMIILVTISKECMLKVVILFLSFRVKWEEQREGTGGERTGEGEGEEEEWEK